MCLMGYLDLCVSIGSRRPLLVFLAIPLFGIIPCKVIQIRVCLLGVSFHSASFFFSPHLDYL